MEKSILELPLHEPYVSALGSYRSGIKIKKSKISELCILFKIPESSGYRVTRVYDSGTQVEHFSIKYIIEQFREISADAVNDVKTISSLYLKPGEVKPADEVLEVIVSAIGCMGGLSLISLKQFNLLSTLVLDCFDGINDRFPEKIDILLSLKENSFPAEFVKNLELWDFKSDNNSYGINNIYTSLIYNYKQSRCYKTFSPNNLIDLLIIHEAAFKSILSHLLNIGYESELSSGGELVLSWGGKPEGVDHQRFILDKLSHIIK